jgi:hypothetical protein
MRFLSLLLLTTPAPVTTKVVIIKRDHRHRRSAHTFRELSFGLVTPRLAATKYLALAQGRILLLDYLRKNLRLLGVPAHRCSNHIRTSPWPEPPRGLECRSSDPDAPPSLNSRCRGLSRTAAYARRFPSVGEPPGIDQLQRPLARQILAGVFLGGDADQLLPLAKNLNGWSARRSRIIARLESR